MKAVALPQPPESSYDLRLDDLEWIRSAFDKSRRIPTLYKPSQNKLAQFTAICCGPWNEDMNVVSKRCELMRQTAPMHMFFFDYAGFGLNQGLFVCLFVCLPPPPPTLLLLLTKNLVLCRSMRCGRQRAQRAPPNRHSLGKGLLSGLCVGVQIRARERHCAEQARAVRSSCRLFVCLFVRRLIGSGGFLACAVSASTWARVSSCSWRSLRASRPPFGSRRSALTRRRHLLPRSCSSRPPLRRRAASRQRCCISPRRPSRLRMCDANFATCTCRRSSPSARSRAGSTPLKSR